MSCNPGQTFHRHTSPPALICRICNTLKKYPYLLACRDGEILGYAYTGPFVGRAAYGWAAETTIYLKEGHKRQGMGKTLYTALETVSRAQNILSLNACIGYPEKEDDYVTLNSVRFHEHMGYSMAGKFHNCGYKFGNWYHMVWMEKQIREHSSHPAPVIPFSELNYRGVEDAAKGLSGG
ncbi:MAG: GNAT family N-acetyltransferase [Lachnospiraceae bacterium]|nr:GNAT family N-acetyltransferase [Lachnospiraceae bacterium]